MLTTALDVLGTIALAVFAWFIWPPLPIAVVGISFLLASRHITKERGA